MNKLIVSPSPHASTRESVPKLMYGVIISLLPALGVSVFYFGIGMVIVTSVSILSCILFEYLIQKFMMKVKPTHLDGSALLTGLLLAFCLPANIPFWMVMIGALVAVGIGKMTFGGLGNNIFNPALVGRVFLFISFPVAMTCLARARTMDEIYRCGDRCHSPGTDEGGPGHENRGGNHA